ncbi:MAG: cell division protein FtsQ/DivIB [Egibacteraceae bacterium]
MTARTSTSSVRMDARIRARRRQIQAARARKRLVRFASGVAVILLAVAAAALARSPLFAVTEVRLVGVSGKQAVEVRELMPIALGENLLTADLGHVERRLEGLPWIRSARAIRHPPSAVEIRVETRQPAAVVRLEGALWTVDAEGVVLAPGGKPGLVEIDGPNSVLPGVGTATSDAAVRNALAVHTALPSRLSHAVDRYDAPSERGLRLHLVLPELSGASPPAPATSSSSSSPLPPGIWVRFGTDERSDEKARVLDALLEQIRRASGRIVEIDVRAPDNPVLVPNGMGAVPLDPAQ